MHGQRAQVGALVGELVAGLVNDNQADILICPPNVFLESLQKAFANTALRLGGQNLHEEKCGAFTGEVSASMLKEFGCTHVIVGHSERRMLFAETSELVAHKFQQAQHAGLIPVLCVGETLEQHQQGVSAQIVKRQLRAVTDLCGIAAFENAVIAYEPVWAIGTGVTATPQQAQQMHAMIRVELGKLDASCAQGLRILYGGSVKAENAAELFAQEDIDGALVGGASLIAEEFIAICRSVV